MQSVYINLKLDMDCCGAHRLSVLFFDIFSACTHPRKQVRSEMASKKVLMVYRLNRAAFDYVVGEIHAKFMTSKVRVCVCV